MAPRAPWDISPDSDANDALNAQLRQSTIECAALTEQIRLKDEEMGRWRMDRDDALAKARSEEERGRVLEDGARKVGEELKRERDRVRVLEDALEHEREEKNRASREVRFIEQDLTNAAAHNASLFATERTTLEKRIAQLERQLERQLASSSSPSTSTSNVSQARISELESKLETLERENARLTEASTSTSSNMNAFASPARNRKGPGIIDSNPFSPSSPSSPFPSSSSWTPKPATGTRRTTATRPTRPRSSSLTLPSDPSSRVPALESEISRLSSESSGLQSKLSKAQNELLKAQNESMALQARMRTDKAHWEALVEQREDEIAELRYLLESSPSHEGSSPRDREEDAELRSQLAAKERKLRAIREGLSGIEEGLVTRVREVQAGLDERRGRTPTPPSSTVLPPPNEEVDTLRAELETARETIATLEHQLSSLPPGSSSSSSHPASDTSPSLSPNELSDLATTLSRLRSERDDALRSLSFLELESGGTISGLEEELVGARSRVAALEKELRTREAHLSALDSDLDGAHARVADVESELDAANGRIQTLERELETRGLEVGAMQQRVEQLEDALNSSNAELGAATSELASASERVANLEEALNSSTDALRSANEELESARAELAVAFERSASLEDALNSANTNLDSVTRDAAYLDARLNDMAGEAMAQGRKAGALALVVQSLSSEAEQLKDAIRTVESQRDELHLAIEHVERTLEDERVHSTTLQEQLDRLPRARTSDVHVQPQPVPTNEITFNLGDFEARPSPSSSVASTSLAVSFAPSHSHAHHSPRHAHGTEYVVDFEDEALRGHASMGLVEDEPSFSEAAFGPAYGDEDSGVLPPSPARTSVHTSVHSDRTYASYRDSRHSRPRHSASASASQANILDPVLAQHSFSARSSPRASHSPFTSSHPPSGPQSESDPHVECRAHISSLEERIIRRNEQIGFHQSEIAQLTMNLTLAEEANAEHLIEWEALVQERDQLVLERDAMVADCGEARDARNEVMRRYDALDEEMEGLKGELGVLRERLAAAAAASSTSTSSTTSTSSSTVLATSTPPSEYTHDQVTALVLEVILAASRAQHLEGALAEAHDALTEACELEGHLLDMQATRDDLLARLDSLGGDYDQLAGELEAKEQELSEMQDSLTMAQSERASVGRQAEATSAELEDLRVDFGDERTRLGQQVEALQRQLSDTEANMASLQRYADGEIHRLHAVSEEAGRTLAELQAQNEQLRMSLDDVREAEHAEVARVENEAAMQVQNALAAKNEAERALHASTQSFEEQVAALRARCDELDQALSEALEARNVTVSQSLQSLADQHQHELKAALAERDDLASRISSMQHAFEHELTSLRSSDAATKSDLAHAVRQLDLMKSNYDLIENRLRVARTEVEERDRALADAQAELDARADDLERWNELKVGMERDLRHRDADISSLDREISKLRNAYEESRNRATTLEIMASAERTRLQKEVGDLRLQIDAATAARDEAESKQASAEERAKTLTKTHRKDELQITMLKQKIHQLQPSAASSAPPSRQQEPAPEQQSAPAQPSSSSVRTASGSSTWRRSTFVPHRNVSGAISSRSNPTPSGSVVSLHQDRPASRTASVNTTSTTQSARLSLRSAEIPTSQSDSVEPPQKEPRTSLFSTTGKRKRTGGEDSENRRPAEPIVMPPSSPSRLRQLAERGLRTIAPITKLSPRKRNSELPPEENPGDESIYPRPLTNPFEIPSEVDLTEAVKPVPAEKPPLRTHSSYSSRDATTRTTSRQRVRLQDIMTSATNMERGH